MTFQTLCIFETAKHMINVCKYNEAISFKNYKDIAVCTQALQVAVKFLAGIPCQTGIICFRIWLLVGVT